MQFTFISCRRRQYADNVIKFIILAGMIFISCCNYRRFTWDELHYYFNQDSLVITATLNDTVFSLEEIENYLNHPVNYSYFPEYDTAHVPIVKVTATNISEKLLIIPMEYIIYWNDPILFKEPAVVYKFGMDKDIYSLSSNIYYTDKFFPIVFPEYKLKPGQSATFKRIFSYIVSSTI